MMMANFLIMILILESAESHILAQEIAPKVEMTIIPKVHLALVSMRFWQTTQPVKLTISKIQMMIGNKGLGSEGFMTLKSSWVLMTYLMCILQWLVKLVMIQENKRKEMEMPFGAHSQKFGSSTIPIEMAKLNPMT